MAYADFDLRKAVQSFGLTENDETDLFGDVQPIEPSDSSASSSTNSRRSLSASIASRPAESTSSLRSSSRRGVGPERKSMFSPGSCSKWTSRED